MDININSEQIETIKSAVLFLGFSVILLMSVIFQFKKQKVNSYIHARDKNSMPDFLGLKSFKGLPGSCNEMHFYNKYGNWRITLGSNTFVDHTPVGVNYTLYLEYIETYEKYRQNGHASIIISDLEEYAVKNNLAFAVKDVVNIHLQEKFEKDESYLQIESFLDNTYLYINYSNK